MIYKFQVLEDDEDEVEVILGYEVRAVGNIVNEKNINEVIHRGKSSRVWNSIDDRIAESVDSNPAIFKTGKPRSIDRLA